MEPRTLRKKAAPAFWLAAVMILMLVFPQGVAFAIHGSDYGLQVISGPPDDSPETDTNITGATHTMTAYLVDPWTDATRTNTGNHPINVDFEMEGTFNNQDEASYTTPDRTCSIDPGQSQCIVSYVGTKTGTGTDTWRAWIDDDDSNLSTEADKDEGRRANTETNEDPRGSGVSTVPVNPGTGCTDGSNEGQQRTDTSGTTPTIQTRKSDCTDVVTKSWQAPAGPAPVVTRLDCDDSGTTNADTEREVNPHGQSPGASDETYTCTVYDQFGDQMADQVVYGEVENDVNDPDLEDGPSYTSPDYNCTTEVDFTEDIEGGTSYCTITIRQAESELGKAFICFWTGTPTEGQTLCSSEATGDNQNANPPYQGDGTGDEDRADKVEKAWHLDQLNCDPETKFNPVGSSHTITCTVESISRNQANQTTRRTGYRVDVEASGANDPQGDGDTTTSRKTPDFTCTTRSMDDPTTPDFNETGTCTITHGPGGTGSTSNTGVTTYRAWIDVDNNDNTDEADPTEGRDENSQPGTDLEPDDTDVVEKTWGAAVSGLTITPKSDSAAVGSCNAYTITTTSGSSGTPAQGATIDVEQRHERAQNTTSNDEPTVSFCLPDEGPNPTLVDETRGDLRPPAENPDNLGTAGGETNGSTDTQGKITIGIRVSPSNGSDGTGRVDIVAFYETNNENDDPESGEPQDTATKTWVASTGRTIDCTPKTGTNPVGAPHVVTCTVKNASGQPVAGEGVTFTENGPGTVSPTSATTDQNGQAKTTATSSETGNQTITGTITASTQNEPDTDQCDRAANDPSGAPAGKCSDSVQKTWVGSTARTIDCTPKTGTNPTGTPHVVTCTVRNESGQPVQNEGVTFTETGPGTVSPTQVATNASGQASTTATSSESGTQTITGTITTSTQNEPDTDPCDRAASDPTGAPAGKCSDSVQKTWVGAECSDGVDNDNDGRTDHPEDRGCESATDQSESPDPALPAQCRNRGSNENVIVGTNGADVITGTDGPDVICGAGGDDVISGLGGADLIAGNGGADNIAGGGGKDNVSGNGGNDGLSGNGGNDSVKGQGGNDTIKGNAGIDSLSGGVGSDSLQGGDDDDILKGGDGNDSLRGGEGRDILDGGPGRDSCFGNAGRDKVTNCE